MTEIVCTETGEVVQDRAATINRLYNEAKGDFVNMAESIVEIGAHLTEQKAELDHGEWTTWVEGNLDFGERQARKYMYLAKHAKILKRNCNSVLPVDAMCKEVKKTRKVNSIKENNPKGETCAVEDLLELVKKGKKFGTIYADPPWKYDNQGTRAATSNHYETMTPEEIADLPVSQLSDEISHLHLWTTNAFLFECPKILDAWGFEYKGVFVWVKSQMGIGNYWRVSHELMVLGVKGNGGFQKKNEMSWIEARRGRHSAKPGKVRNIIEGVSPGPRLELFGRNGVNGWTVWGNEIEKDLFYKAD